MAAFLENIGEDVSKPVDSILSKVMGSSGEAGTAKVLLVGGIIGAGSGMAAKMIMGAATMKPGGSLDSGFLKKIEDMVGMTAQVGLSAIAGAGTGLTLSVLGYPHAEAWAALSGVSAAVLPYIVTL